MLHPLFSLFGVPMTPFSAALLVLALMFFVWACVHPNKH